MGLGQDVKSLLWHLLGGTRGGDTRVRILRALEQRPYNPNQLADRLDLDYKTVTYHLDRLAANSLVEADDEDYGTMYHLTDVMEDHTDVLDEIAEKINTSTGNGEDTG
jgi:DNA-binding transcriptional ArsR family regulator